MTTLGLNAQQLQKMQTQPGFIAALDQSGGSTPNALRLYGIKEGAWSNEDEMFAIVHQMRTRLITSPSFTGERIVGAILFENTMPSRAELFSVSYQPGSDQRIRPDSDGRRRKNDWRTDRAVAQSPSRTG